MKMIGVELSKFYSDKYRINHEVIEILKETNSMYKIGNQTGLTYCCRSQMSKSEMNRVVFYNFEDHNDNRSDCISLKVYGACSEDKVDETIVRLKNQILEFAKVEISSRMTSLLKLQETINGLGE